MGKKTRLEAALSTGMNALISGTHISSNPYVLSQEQSDQWIKGFRYAAEKQRRDAAVLVGGDLVNERLAAQLTIYEGDGRQPISGEKPVVPVVGWACEGYAIAKSGNESYFPVDPPTLQDVSRAVGFVAFKDYGEAVEEFLMYRKASGEWELALNLRQAEKANAGS